MDNLTGKCALVTGASRGIGRAIALALAAVGADIAVNYRERRAEAEAVAAEIRKRGRHVVALAADVASEEEVKRLVEAVTSALGPIEILVNNVGVSWPVTFDTLDTKVWNDTLAINLTSAFLVTQAILPGMRARHWGRIINISSTAAQVGGIVGPHYAASKAGMIGMTHGYASMLAGEGITANVVAPAMIDTEMIRSNDRARPEKIPLGRFGRVEEVADAVVMLARNGYITGQTINVNGGFYMS
ncbi:MAG: 3-oxoacyl-ACP reductase FabG [Desulfobulbaceae bacterium]|jgi:3-oxoacyl-[acyl-carrier protein] reductase|nr:3-oxoacyl-ACP reductase FabG [Desulfobulbaceae bacterium]